MRSNLNAGRLLALAAALFALALVGAGCGDDDGSAAGDDEAEVASVVEESVAFEDPPTVCEENFSDRALEDNFDGKDREAQLADCKDDEPSDLSEIEVTGLVIEGGKATADVSASNGEETSEITVELVDEGGWKIDAVR
jgi:hypothetical protein